MTASSLVPKTHARSISLPCRPPLIASQFDKCLEKLKVPEAGCSSFVIGGKLHGLVELYECIDQLLDLQSTQQMILNECDRERVSQVMDDSLRLLDVCGITNDVLLQTKECVRDFASVLRRKRGHRAEYASEVSKCMTSRRNTKRLIQKYLKSLMIREDPKKNHENTTVAKMFLVAEHATLKVFESLLTFLSGSGGHDSNWCSIFNFIILSKIAIAMEDCRDFETLDAALFSNTTYDITYIEAQNLQCKLADLELNIQGFEETIDCIFRHQIRARVSLLNILSHYTALKSRNPCFGCLTKL